MSINELLSFLLMIIVPLALVLSGLMFRRRTNEPWWSKLLIVLGIVLITLVFIVQIR